MTDYNITTRTTVRTHLAQGQRFDVTRPHFYRNPTILVKEVEVEIVGAECTEVLLRGNPYKSDGTLGQNSGVAVLTPLNADDEGLQNEATLVGWDVVPSDLRSEIARQISVYARD